MNTYELQIQINYTAHISALDAGCRDEDDGRLYVGDLNDSEKPIRFGRYWSSTVSGEDFAFCMYFYDNYGVNCSEDCVRNRGRSVRCVQDEQ
jgi:uncharacterized protein (TIGR02145 family)